MKRFAAACALAIAVVIACDEPVSLPPTGSISIRFASSDDAATAASLRSDPREPEPGLLDRLADRRPGEEQAEVPEVVRGAEAPAEPSSHFTEYRIRLQGPSSRDTTVSAGTTSVTLGGLSVGTYSVIVEGLVSDSIDYYGRADGVEVAKGQTATADLTDSFRSVRPTLNSFPADTTKLKVQAVWSRVAIATGYRVQYGLNPDFSAASEVTPSPGTDTTAFITVSTAGTYHVRVFTTASGLSNLRPSDSRTFKVASDTVSNDPLSAPGLREGYGEVHDTLSGFNIMPAGDEDWFSLTACKADTLTIETVAARLNPASPLNTVLRLFRKDGTTQVQSNDNLDGSTTDSRIQVVAPAQDTFKIEVTGSGSSTGHYDLIYRVRPGDGRTGTTCTPVVDASKSTVAVSASTIAAGQTATFTLTAKDQNGDQMAAGGSTVAFSLSGGTSNGTIGTVTDNNNGTYTATFTGEVAGTASTVNATIDGAAVTTALPTITVTAGTFTKLGFVVHPSGATAGSVIQPVIEVAAQDAYGNLVTAATGFVTVAIGNNPAGGTLFGSVSKTFLGGVAKFDDLKIDKAADDYTLTAARSGVTGATSNPFAIVPAAAQKLAFVVQPASGTGGDSIKPGIQVAVRDAFGNTVIGFNTSITLALADNPGGATVSGTPTRATQDGIATFDDIALNKAATGYTLKATATLLDSAVSTPFDIAVGPPKHLVFTTQPGSATAGAILSPEVKVTVTDNGGNIVTTASDTVTMGFGVDASGGAATLSGTKKVKPSSGVATFNNLSIDKAATGYALAASSGGIAPDTTGTFDIEPGTAYQLAFSVQPPNATSGVIMDPHPQVAVQDAFGNLVSGATNFVTVAIGTNPPGDATLSGNATRQASGGTVTYDDLSINKAGSGFTLAASASGLVGATSSAFDVAVQIVVSPSKSSAGASPSVDVIANGDSVSTITVTVRDPESNPLSGQTVELGATGSANQITPASATTNSSGVATFTIASTKAETKTITATVNPGASQVVLDQKPTVQFIADASTISATLSTATASPASPDTVVADGEQRSTITVTVLDANSNPVPGQTVLIATEGSSNASLTQPGATDAGGVAVGAVTRLLADGVTANDTITVTVDTSATGTDVILTATPIVVFKGAPCTSVNATQSTVTASQDTVANGSDPITITVTVNNCAGDPLSGQTVEIAVSGSGNAIDPSSATSDASGLATFTVRSTVAESKTVTVTVNPGADQRVLATKPTIVFKAGPATALAFKVQPANTTAGATISPAVQVAVVDAYANTVSDSTNAITLAFENNPTGAPLVGTTPVNASGGVATFSDLSITSAATGYTLRATAEGTSLTSVVSNSFNITPAAATGLAFQLQPPASVIAGATFSAEVKVVDAYGNTVTSATNSISLAFGTKPDTTAALAGTTTRSAVSGVATFNNLSVDKAATGYTLDASASGLTGAGSTAFNVTAASAAQLGFKVEPGNTAAGSSISPAVEVAVQDAFGNTVTGDGDSVFVSIANDPTGGATLSGATRKKAVAGIATFGDLSIQKAATGYTLRAARPGLTEDVSASFNITAAAASQLAFAVQPATTAAGSAINPAVQVTAQDPYGNTVTGYADSVSVAIANNPSGGVLSGTKKVKASSGVATFSDLSIDKTGTGYTLSAAATGLTGVTSAGFDITSATAAKLGFIVQPSAVVAGASIAPAVQVAVQDNLGNTVAGATHAVTIAIGNNVGGATLFGTTTVAAENGVATFSNLSLDKAGVGYTLAASSSGLTGATSDGFTVSASSPSASTSSVTANPADPDSVVADGVQTSTITVVVRDQYGNPVPGDTVTLAATGTGNTIAQPTARTDANGTATGTIASTAAETKTVTATSGGSLALEQTASVKFYAGLVNGANSDVTVLPDTALANAVDSITIIVTVKDNNSNPVPGQTVQIAVSGSGNTVTQPASTTDALGVATGSVKSTKAESKTVTVTVNPGAGQVILADQPTVVFRPGLPAKVGFVVQPTNVAAGASIAPDIQAAIQDAYGNTVDTATADITIAIASGTGTPGAALYGTPTQPANNGIATFTGIKLDSAGTGYRLEGSAAALTTGASEPFNVVPGAVYTVTVTPSADSIYTLGGSVTFTATARDSVGNVIPDATFSWGSSNEPVAIVDGAGTVTAMARGLTTITATSGSKSGTADLAVAVRLAGIATAAQTAPPQIFSSGDLPGTYTELTPAAFNAIATAADLRAQYDVLLFAYDSDGSVDASWARLRAYLALGGGIVFEDPNNVGDLADILTGAADNLSGSGIALLPVPALTDGIANSFTNSHISFTAWSDSLAHFVLRDTKALGLYGRFGSGCIVVTGTDQAKDGSRGAADPAGNQYNFLLKEVLFAANCPLNATPGTVASVRIFPKSVTFTDAGQQAQLRGTALDEAGTPVVGAPITWTSLNPDVATVDASSGLVTSVRNGQAAIQAEGSGADYALAGAAQPSSVILNAWGTEVAANVLSTSYLLKIWASSADNLVAVGDGGRIVRFNGMDWDTMDSGNPNWLWGVWGSSATDVYAVGNNGTLLHSTGGAFTALPDPSSGSAHFYGVWGSGPNDVFIVGSGGVIYHFDGTNWAQMVSNTSNALQSVWGTAWNNVWAVGASGTILRFDGVSWQPVTSPVTGTFRAVSGSGPNNVFAVGGTGSQIAHFNGSIWEAQSIPASYTFYDVWAASGNEAIAVGYQAILRYNGSAWTAMLHAAPGWVLGVWGVADGQLRAVGQGGEVFRGLRGAGPIVKTEVTPSGATNNGISTTRQYRALPRDASDNVVTPASLAWTSHNTNVATVSSAGVATTTGSGQTVLEANADGVLGYGLFTVTVSTATAVNLFDSTYSGNTNFLWSIWGRNANNIYAVGGNGTILRTTDGTNWGSVGPGGGHFRGIWGSADNDIWAVGDGGRIAHYNGSMWSDITPVNSIILYGVWGAAPNDVWAVGGSGQILHYDGSGWAVDTTIGTYTWVNVWGSSRDTVYVVGTSGQIRRFNGTTWEEAGMGTGTTATLYEVWGASGRDVFVVGTGGTVLRYQGSGWTLTTPTTASLYALWGTASNDVYAAGSPLDGVGTVLRFNGTSWSPLVSRTTNSIYGIWGTNADDVWMTTSGGLIRRGVRGGVISPSQQPSFAARTNGYTLMKNSSNGSNYFYTVGGSTTGGSYRYKYTLAGAFVDSFSTSRDNRALLYRPASGVFYLKDYARDWYTVDIASGATTLVFADSFVNAQSSPAITLTGAFEILELSSGTIRRLRSDGFLLGTISSITAGSYPSDGALATDGYYLYTWNHSTRVVYVYSKTGTPITSFTLPSGPTNGFSLSFANGMLWASNGSTWYPYRLNVTP